MRQRLVLLSVSTALLTSGVAQDSAAAATNFDVTANGASAYVMGGVNNPTLTLTRGQTYTFNVIPGGHPFWITTERGAGNAESNAFSQGVAGNGASPGTVTFVVPVSAPATLFYQCNFHDTMGGTLAIVSPPGVPSVGRNTLAVLAGLLLLIAAVSLRGRARLRRRGQSTTAAMRWNDQ